MNECGGQRGGGTFDNVTDVGGVGEHLEDVLGRTTLLHDVLYHVRSLERKREV